MAKAMKYTEALTNTVILCATTTLIQTFICMMVGYGFARHHFPLKNLLFLFVIFTIIIPPQALMIPLYLHFRFFDVFNIVTALRGEPGLLNSPAPFLLLALTGQGLRNGLFIFMFRQSFRSMPLETEEAAEVDGASPPGIFTRIMIPNAVTMIATVVLFSLVWQWNDTFYVNFFMPKFRVLANEYNSCMSNFSMVLSDEGISSLVYNLRDGRVIDLLKNAAIFLVMMPLLAFYAVAQRFFVESIERSGLVG